MNASQDVLKIISYKLGINETIISLLFDRGLNTEEKIKTFLYGSLDDLEPVSIFTDGVKIKNLILKHLSQNSKIIIYGDYDCDGILASSMLYLSLKKIGANVEVFIPDRKEDGYGLNLSSLSNIIDSKKPNLIITVDCGITSVSEVNFLQKRGVDIIITDHHVPSNELPNCLIMNPHLTKGSTPLCGAGVAYKLIQILFGEKESQQYLDLCAIATIADIVPLVGDNRILAKEGLNVLSGYVKRTGLQYLLNELNLSYPKKIKSSDISFKIAPTLNSSGRLSNAQKSFELMTTRNEKYAKVLSKELVIENEERKNITDDVFNKANVLLIDYNLAHNAIIVLKDNWEAGVLGIAASSLANKFNRPVILFSKDGDMLKGSCRSIKGVNILDLLNECSGLIENYGGHSMAAGLTLKNENFDFFVKKINLLAKQIYAPDVFKHKFYYDIELDFDDLDINFANQLALLEPYGSANNKPIFKTSKNTIEVEQIKLHPHLKSKLNNGVELIMFNKLEHFHLLKSGLSKNLYYYIDINEFRNKKTIQCNILDIEYTNNYLDDSFLDLEILNRYIVNYDNNKKSLKKKHYSSTENFGKVLLVFTKKTFDLLSSKFPEYNKNIIKLYSSNAFNTILLAPSKKESFDYFEEIIVYDDPPNEYLENLILKYGNIVKKGDISHLSSIDFKNYNFNRNKLVKTFYAIRSSEDKKLTSIYNAIKKTDHMLNDFDWFASLLIFKELNIISIDEGILQISNEKRNLNDSKIFTLIKNKDN
ncbi:MAG TPA: single-stranded-DNA-specific exonuclease RecJ [Clostridiales bacterium]|nr:single-stranded-DNA-specific exonuclease RecJ [Clostridiales bacterium]